MMILFRSLVDLAQERLKNLLLQTAGLIDSRNLLPQLPDGLLLVFIIDLIQAQFVKDGLHLGLELAILATIGDVQGLALLLAAALQRLVDHPRALVILNISTDLPNDGRIAVSVEEVVLDLEVLAEGDQDVVSLAEVFGGGELEIVQSESDGQIEAIIRGLVGDDEHVFFHGEVGQVDIVLRGGDQIAQLAQLRLPGGLVEQFNEIDVGGVRAEVLFENHVDAGLEHEGVVDGDQADAGLSVPARLATAGHRAVHDIVTDEEESLEQLGQPAEGAEVFELLVGQRLL